jgi:hypothetical protein
MDSSESQIRQKGEENWQRWVGGMMYRLGVVNVINGGIEKGERKRGKREIGS